MAPGRRRLLVSLKAVKASPLLTWSRCSLVILLTATSPCPLSLVGSSRKTQLSSCPGPHLSDAFCATVVIPHLTQVTRARGGGRPAPCRRPLDGFPRASVLLHGHGPLSCLSFYTLPLQSYFTFSRLLCPISGLEFIFVIFFTFPSWTFSLFFFF